MATQEIDVVQATEARLPALQQEAEALQIVTKDDYLEAARCWTGLKQAKRQVDAVLGHQATLAHATWKNAVAMRDKMLEAIDGPMRTLKGKMERWDTEQERFRQEEQRRLEELARKAEEERQLAEALAAEASGDSQTAEAILAEEPARPAAIIPKTTPKVAGISYRENWTFEIVNPALLPREYLIPDEVKIGQVVRAMKAETNIPGVRVKHERV